MPLRWPWAGALEPPSASRTAPPATDAKAKARDDPCRGTPAALTSTRRSAPRAPGATTRPHGSNSEDEGPHFTSHLVDPTRSALQWHCKVTSVSSTGHRRWGLGPLSQLGERLREAQMSALCQSVSKSQHSTLAWGALKDRRGERDPCSPCATIRCRRSARSWLWRSARTVL
jgi:hypothetical protein